MATTLSEKELPLVRTRLTHTLFFFVHLLEIGVREINSLLNGGDMNG
nr:MAG TPA: hypothetical protein [Caudoviricetes sp.]